jgi:hypothetical protein
MKHLQESFKTDSMSRSQVYFEALVADVLQHIRHDSQRVFSTGPGALAGGEKEKTSPCLGGSRPDDLAGARDQERPSLSGVTKAGEMIAKFRGDCQEDADFMEPDQT